MPQGRSGHRTLLVVDIERYGDPVRDDQTRIHLRESLRDALIEALNGSGIGRPEHMNDTGDGWLVVLDADAKVPVLEAVTSSLPQALRAHGVGTSGDERLRVRAVVHAGEVLFDDGVPVGKQVNRAFRMVEAHTLRACLHAASGSLVVGLSDYVYENVVHQRHAGLDRSLFEPVLVEVKEERCTVWVYAPGDPGVAARAGVIHAVGPGDQAPGIGIAHTSGDAQLADRLAGQLSRAGYHVAYKGPVLADESGDSLADDATAVLAPGCPLFVCGTVRALGTGWAHRLAKATGRHPDALVLPVRMEKGAYLEMLGWEAAIAEWCRDEDGAVRELCAALVRRYPVGQATPDSGLSGADLEERYRSLVLSNYDIYDWTGLPQRDPNLTTSKLELRRLYVALRVIVESSVDTGMDPDRLATLEFERDEQRGLWAFQRAQRTRRNDDELRRVPIGERLGASRRLVVLGDPGSGKSTLLKWIATAYLLRLEGTLDWRDLPDVGTLPDADWLPVMIRCRELDYDKPVLAFDDALQQSLHKLVIHKDQADRIHQMLLERLAAGKALLLVDGLDEINDPRARSSFCEQIERAHLAYPDAPIIVTCRIVGYREMSRRIGRGFEHVKVADLDRRDKDEFARRWCTLTLPPARVEAAVEGLTKDIHSTDRIERLTGNPLLLTTMALVRGYLGRLPNRRGDLYDEAISVLLNWRPDIGEPLTPAEALPQLEYIAYEMCARKVQRLRVDELVGLCARMREEFPNIHAAGRHDPELFIRLVEERTSLLNETGYVRHQGQLVGVYEFRHLSFQEYLAGVSLARGRFPDHHAGQPVSAAVGPLAAPVWSTPNENQEPKMVAPENWLEPIRLCATACNSSDVDALLLAVLTPNDDEDAALTARPRAVLAALCLADEPDASSEMAERVIQTLIDQVNDEDGAGYSRNELDQAAAELASSRWRGQLYGALLDTYLGLPSLDRIPIGAVYGRVVTDTDNPSDDPTAWAADITMGLGSNDTISRVGAALRAGGASSWTKVVRAYDAVGLTERLIRQCAADSPAADAAAWALSQLANVYEPASPFLPQIPFPSPAGWYLTSTELQLLTRIIEGEHRLSDAALVSLYGLACKERIRAAVPRARASLQHADGRIRAAATMVLGGFQDLPSCAALGHHLAEDPNPKVRARAARALGWLDDPTALPVLSGAMRDPEGAVRAAAAGALGILGDLSSLPLLIDATADADASVWESAVEALGDIRDPRATAAVVSLLHHGDAKVREAAARALSWRDTLGAEAALTRLNDEDANVRRNAIATLHSTGHLADDEAAVNRVITLLTDSSPRVRAAAVHALGDLRALRLASALRQRLADDNASVVADALGALSALGVADDPALRQEILRHLEHEDERVIQAAMRVLICMGIPDLDELVADVIRRKPSRGLFLAAAGIDGSRCHPLHTFGVWRPAVVNALSQHCADQDDELRDGAILARCALGSTDYVDDLIRLANTCDYTTMSDLRRCLDYLTADHALPALTQLSRAKAACVRYDVADLLADLGQAACLAPLSQLLEDPNDWVRTAAAMALDQLPTTAEVAEALIRHFEDPSPRVRSRIAYALWDSKDEPATSALIGRLQDPSSQVRRAVIGALGGRPGHLVVPILLSALESDDHRTRDAAAWALGRTEQDKPTTNRLIAMLAETKVGARIAAIRALPLHQHPDLAESVLPELDHPDERVQEAAFDKLWPERHPAAVERLQTELHAPKAQRRRQAVSRIARTRDALDRRLLSSDLDGYRPFRDPRCPVTLGDVRLAADRLRLPTEEVKLRYEALADELPLHLTWSSQS
jgi:HEAT repeat protein